VVASEGKLCPRELSSVVRTVHKNMQGPGFKPRPPPKKSEGKL
jgi:hypothetical protein